MHFAKVGRRSQLVDEAIEYVTNRNRIGYLQALWDEMRAKFTGVKVIRLRHRLTIL